VAGAIIGDGRPGRAPADSFLMLRHSVALGEYILSARGGAAERHHCVV
jgi:hypothetical protein